MADEREGQDNDGPESDTKRVADQDTIQTEGRKENDAKPLNASENDGGPERYPSVRQDDAVERTGRTEEVTGEATGESRSFDPRADAPTPRQGAGDGSAKQRGFESGQGDPAAGKR